MLLIFNKNLIICLNSQLSLCCFGSHAKLGLYKMLLHRAPNAPSLLIALEGHSALHTFILKLLSMCRWEMSAQPKIVVKIESEEDMLAL